MIFTDQKKIRNCSYSGPGLSKKAKETNFLLLGPSHTPLCKNQTSIKARKKPLRNARLSETLTHVLATLLDIKTSFCALIRRRTITMVYAIPGPAATQAKFLWFCIAPQQRPLDSRTRTTTSTRFDLKIFRVFSNYRHPRKAVHCTSFSPKKLALLSLLKELKPSRPQMIKALTL